MSDKRILCMLKNNCKLISLSHSLQSNNTERAYFTFYYIRLEKNSVFHAKYQPILANIVNNNTEITCDMIDVIFMLCIVI